MSVIVPSYNSAHTIRPTLNSIMKQAFDEPFEVIVVDSSADDTAAIITAEFPQVILIRREKQTDPGTARNIAISRTRGDIIACLDADCIAPRDWLARMVSAQRAGHAVVGGSVVNGNPNSLISWAGYMSEFREWLPVGEPRTMASIPTCNISYHRSIFVRYGGFPTEFYPQEDLLFHWRLAQHGQDIWFDPTICVQHVHRANWRSFARHSRRIGRITARVLKLTGDEGVLLARSPWLAIPAALLLPLVKWARTVDVFRRQRPDLLHRHLFALFPLLAGLYVWALGFAEGSLAPPLRIDSQHVVWQAGP
ncbi:MAG TPA: glycosyltransferase [Chloroflexi bacterium]|nr:glycosyltransferase [Chloroflexota bacterium]